MPTKVRCKVKYLKVSSDKFIEVVKGTDSELTFTYSFNQDISDYTPFLTVKLSHNSKHKLIDLEASDFDTINKKIKFDVPFQDNDLYSRDYVFDVVLEDDINEKRLPFTSGIYRVNSSVRY